MPADPKVIAKFDAGHRPGRPDACWPWLGRTARGQGLIRVYVPPDRELRVAAHRVAYERGNGPIPAGMVVRQRCGNPKCVNPAHLFLSRMGDRAPAADPIPPAVAAELPPALFAALPALDALGGAHAAAIRAEVRRAAARLETLKALEALIQAAGRQLADADAAPAAAPAPGPAPKAKPKPKKAPPRPTGTTGTPSKLTLRLLHLLGNRERYAVPGLAAGLQATESAVRFALSCDWFAVEDGHARITDAGLARLLAEGGNP